MNRTDREYIIDDLNSLAYCKTRKNISTADFEHYFNRILALDEGCMDVLADKVWLLAHKRKQQPAFPTPFCSDSESEEYYLIRRIVNCEDSSHFYKATKEQLLSSISTVFYENLMWNFERYKDIYIRNYVSAKETNFIKATDNLFRFFALSIHAFEALYTNNKHKIDFINNLYQDVIFTNIAYIHWLEEQDEKYSAFYNARLNAFVKEIHGHDIKEGVIRYRKVRFCFNTDYRRGTDVTEMESNGLWLIFQLGLAAYCFSRLGCDSFLFAVPGTCLAAYALGTVWRKRKYSKLLYGNLYDQYMSSTPKNGTKKISSSTVSTLSQDSSAVTPEEVDIFISSRPSGERFFALNNSLDNINEAKRILRQAFGEDKKEKYELFVQTRCTQYIQPYIEYISDKGERLTDEEISRFVETFTKIEQILLFKAKELENEQDDYKRIEFGVIEKDIDDYMSTFVDTTPSTDRKDVENNGTYTIR